MLDVLALLPSARSPCRVALAAVVLFERVFDLHIILDFHASQARGQQEHCQCARRMAQMEVPSEG